MTQNQLESKQIQCPYCWQRIDVLIDQSQGSHSYVEDCQVCCHPIEFIVSYNIENHLQVSVRSDDG